MLTPQINVVIWDTIHHFLKSLRYAVKTTMSLYIRKLQYQKASRAIYIYIIITTHSFCGQAAIPEVGQKCLPRRDTFPDILHKLM